MSDSRPALQDICPSLSPLQAAQVYLAHGWAPISIPIGTKAPRLTGWQNLRLSETNLPTYFFDHAVLNGDGGPDGQNIGLLLGDPSGGLTDIDLDAREAVELAAFFLPPTDAIFGRKAKPRSHWLYVTAPVASTAKFKAPDGTMLVELRATGCQTVVPPSIHAELVCWDQAGEPKAIDPGDLHRAVARLAAASLLARSWPQQGMRHEAALALGGALLRAGWDADDVAWFVEQVAVAAGDEEAERRRQDV